MSIATAENTAYAGLREFLKEFPGWQVAVDNGCLERLFNPREAEVEVHMYRLPEPARMIAERCGKPERAVGGILDAMSEKGLIWRWYIRGEPLYFLRRRVPT